MVINLELDKSKIKVVFMGSPEIAVPVFEVLRENYDLVGVVTQPDRPAGRGKKDVAPPVKIAAEASGIPVFQPERIRKPEAFETIAAWNPDVIVVMAYGQILRQNLLDLPKAGCINVHASILPRWRGASPIQAVIRAGDETTGVSIMRMDAGMDTGPVYSVHEIAVDPSETAETLSVKLAKLGADAVARDLPRILNGEIAAKPQPEYGVTLTGLIRKEDGELDLNQPAAVLERLVRAYCPWPGTSIQIDGMMLKILRAHVDTRDSDAPIGTRAVVGKFPAIKAGDRFLVLDEVQAPGKKAMAGNAFLGGFRTWISANGANS